VRYGKPQSRARLARMLLGCSRDGTHDPAPRAGADRQHRVGVPDRGHLGRAASDAAFERKRPDHAGWLAQPPASDHAAELPLRSDPRRSGRWHPGPRRQPEQSLRHRALQDVARPLRPDSDRLCRHRHPRLPEHLRRQRRGHACHHHPPDRAARAAQNRLLSRAARQRRGRAAAQRLRARAARPWLAHQPGLVVHWQDHGPRGRPCCDGAAVRRTRHPDLGHRCHRLRQSPWSASTTRPTRAPPTRP
jgi:hypothetical protein